MDQDRDGTVSMDDLKEVYASLGNVKAKLSLLLKNAKMIFVFVCLDR